MKNTHLRLALGLCAALLALTIFGATAALAAPANDNWANAHDFGTVANISSYADNNQDATSDSSSPAIVGTNAGYRSLWYKWTSPFDGWVTLYTCGPPDTVDTILGVFNSAATVPTFAQLNRVAGDDDGCLSGGGQSQLEFPVVSGKSYWFVVAGYDNTSSSYGAFSLTLTSGFEGLVFPSIEFGLTNKVGDTLHLDSGRWNGPTPNYTYQWHRCDVGPTACIPIPGANDDDYKLVGADFGKVINATMQVKSGASTAYVTSPYSTPILDGDSDGDGFLDRADPCPTLAGASSNGCPPVTSAPVIRLLPFAPPKAIATSKVTKKGVITLNKFNFTCPADATARCAVAVTVNSTGKRTAKLAANLIGLNLAEKLRMIPLTLNKTGRKLLKKHRSIQVTVRVKITAPGYEPKTFISKMKIGGSSSVANPLYDIKSK